METANWSWFSCQPQALFLVRFAYNFCETITNTFSVCGRDLWRCSSRCEFNHKNPLVWTVCGWQCSPLCTQTLTYRLFIKALVLSLSVSLNFPRIQLNFIICAQLLKGTARTTGFSLGITISTRVSPCSTCSV